MQIFIGLLLNSVRSSQTLALRATLLIERSAGGLEALAGLTTSVPGLTVLAESLVFGHFGGALWVLFRIAILGVAGKFGIRKGVHVEGRGDIRQESSSRRGHNDILQSFSTIRNGGGWAVGSPCRRRREKEKHRYHQREETRAA